MLERRPRNVGHDIEHARTRVPDGSDFIEVEVAQTLQIPQAQAGAHHNQQLAPPAPA